MCLCMCCLAFCCEVNVNNYVGLETCDSGLHMKIAMWVQIILQLYNFKYCVLNATYTPYKYVYDKMSSMYMTMYCKAFIGIHTKGDVLCAFV